ncbi:MAG: SIR2 family protein [Halodesulfovibrio sp.]|uniref:SIR2 family protein n=1 Tax=Halodesulfovibrio sp. TaxID=1912772 RepID=UPI00359E957C
MADIGSKWEGNLSRINGKEFSDKDDIFSLFPTDQDKEELSQLIKPWLSAIFQSEHLSLLLGSGFTTAVATQAGVKAAGMQPSYDGFPTAKLLEEKVKESATKAKRSVPNVEDQIRVANNLLEGMKILNHECANVLDGAIKNLLTRFLQSISETERQLGAAISVEEVKNELSASDMLVSFLLSFANRTASRERLNIFTTNYERLVEVGADLAGLRVVDRFVGCLEPVFRSSRVNVDMHYNPPGIRGEPRYLEGVVRLTKLHGSLDWKYKNGFVRKVGLPFGASVDHPEFNTDVSGSVMIYPNSAKDRETSEYPYVELFRDYAATVCQPNSALVTFGYGFGDEHINRVIEDMLSIPSTHLVIISYDNAGGRIESFCQKVGRKEQVTLLIGNHFGQMSELVENYLPQPAVDLLKLRQAELARRMFVPEPQAKDEKKNIDVADEDVKF